MGKRYKRGALLERRVKKLLEKDGYYVVRAAGSKGIADLVAIKNSQAYLIQVKSERISAIERIMLVETAASCGAFPVIALYKRKLRRFIFVDPRDEGGNAYAEGQSPTSKPQRNRHSTSNTSNHPSGTESFGILN